MKVHENSRAPTSGEASSKSEPSTIWQSVQDKLRKRFGVVGTLVILSVGIWWQWDHVSKLPGIGPFVDYLTEAPLPRATNGKFNIAIAHLEGDDGHQMEAKIRESLSDFPAVSTLSFDRVIESEHSNNTQDERKAHDRARAMLKESGADVLIWGVVLKQGDESIPKLYWTPSEALAERIPPGRYPFKISEDLRLPIVFWRDLTHILGLLVIENEKEFLTPDGPHQRDQLEPFIGRVRELLTSSEANQWSGATRVEVQRIFATALSMYAYYDAPQSNETQPLLEAVAVLGDALKDAGPQKSPVEWAKTQSALGNAYFVLGLRASDTVSLKRAIVSYRAALQEWMREESPLAAAATLNNLGCALGALGKQTSNTETLKETVFVFQQLSKTFERSKQPLQWAGAQNNLGEALVTIGKQTHDSKAFDDGIVAYREALTAITPQSAPLEWASGQRSIGDALIFLGLESHDPARLTAAISAYAAALKELERDRAPYDWAAIYGMEGTAHELLGEWKSSSSELRQALDDYQIALSGFRDVKDATSVRMAELRITQIDEQLRKQTSEK
ncbi:hypothetical protein [Paraburkholderia guartelaensis]|uniref:Tetratricopeptide repeat protein n=1 Tax=Paraburkholderia guartelaensis TaxID=2546446 RepID=A0ABU9SDS7_9BURK